MKWVVQTFSLGNLKEKRNEEEKEVGRKEGSREREGESRRSQRSTGKESARDEQKYCQTEARGGFNKDQVENIELSSFQALCYVLKMR